MTNIERFCEVMEFLRNNKSARYSAQDLMVIGECNECTIRSWISIMQKRKWIKPSGSAKNFGIRGMKPVLWQWCGGDNGSNT